MNASPKELLEKVKKLEIKYKKLIEDLKNKYEKAYLEDVVEKMLDPDPLKK